MPVNQPQLIYMFCFCLPPTALFTEYTMVFGSILAKFTTTPLGAAVKKSETFNFF